MTGPSDKRSVLVCGSGVAAHCSTLLLGRAGVDVRLVETERPRIPAIMIGDATRALIEDVFARAGVWQGLHKIKRRVVAWGGEARTLPHSAVVLSEEELSLRLRSGSASGVAGEADWTIYAGRPLHTSAVVRSFGSRDAAAVEVRLNGPSDTCWIESLPEGWLFLIPNSPESGWLLAVGGSSDLLLGASRLIAPQIASIGRNGKAFASQPSMADPICGAGWLACGTAAMAFDPICGDGTGNAVREALLGAAVVRAGGGEDVIEHYQRRLVLGFLRHLEQCRTFYSTGGAGEWWRAQLEGALQGISWCLAALEPARESRYRLNGYDLVRID